ncbi:MAG TPA: thiamine phosphate synthase [Armatimonadota bacterium]|jgi:thiamine-phosphate pyrophosphorylase
MDGIYVITERKRGHVEIAQAALEGGARTIQLRDKLASTWQMVAWAEKMRRLCEQYRALFIINDRLDVAMAAGAWGVHLGTEDMPIPHARRILGREAVIGASVANVFEARAAQAAGASYVAVGSIYPTDTKPDAGPPIGPSIISEIQASVTIPVIAIGGINLDNLEECRKAGASSVGVVSAVTAAQDMVQATRALVERWNEAGAALTHAG